ncbi:Reverse transcriptase (RNA-dependent DNA polymerase) [Nitrosospira multiformis]|uniref:Reverse transcriptase (RNA-dependent DNA polymerase) n=1 Tax=Nitrosospira multiformis TaxID=1231 RepID=A0A1H9Y8X3_9PROT|nr:reverse transcriptase domain-containing protein [Nitrosospira multiformis]SES65377.1 Reverse transcriptase (RNA-dependent DNA polymerase) [Nitrosospira multiformis]
MERSLQEGKSILAITMDIEQFYHRVSPKFLLRKTFLDSIKLSLYRQESIFTRALLAAIDVWYKSTPDYVDRPEGGIPVGLSASKIIANVLLSNFDNELVDRLKPIYYGRYVDDIFLVFENLEGLTTARQVTKRIADVLAPELVLESNDTEAPSLKLRLPYAKDSELLFVGKKQKIFALSSSHGLDLIQHIREQIRIQSSEYRLLPAVPTTGVRRASKALLATPNATLQVDALRKADVVSVKRLGVSLLLRDLEAYSADLHPESWSEIRKEFYGLAKRHILTPIGFFEFFGYLPRIFGLMLTSRDVREASQLIEDLIAVANLVKRTTTVGEAAQLPKFRLCLVQYAQAFLQAGLQAATERTLKLDRQYLKVLHALLGLDKDIKIPTSLRCLKTRAHQILLADWGRRPYKDYWYLSQENDEKGPPIPRQLEIQRKIRLGGIRRFSTQSTNLKIPHWPALAFPTRPLRIDEIALVAPNVLSDPVQFKHAILVLRGAKVSARSHLGFVLGSEAGNEEPAIFIVPGHSKKLIGVAITSLETTEVQWAKAAKGKQDRSIERYRNLNGLVNQILRETKTPDYIVFPELSIPLRWGLRIARKLAANGVSLLAGVEYHRDRTTGRLRNDSLISLVTDWPGYASHVARLQPKFFPAHGEKVNLANLRLGKRGHFFKPSGLYVKPTLYVHRGFCFSILICSDLTNIAHRHQLRGKVDALFALEWNPDIKTFAPLIEATANDLHAYVAQVNNRTYGDSRLRVPAVEDYLRDVVQVKGGISDYYVLGEIDYLALRKEQCRPPRKRKFKPVPIGYKFSPLRKKAK